MSMNTPLGQVVQTTPIKQFTELTSFDVQQYLLAINNIAQGDGARISLQNLINSSISSDAGNLLEVGQDGKLSVKSGAFSLDNGWLIAPSVSVNWTENTLTSIDGEFYLNGVLYPSLSTFTVTNVPTTIGANYLYYNFSTEQFEWSVGYPAVEPTVQIANIVAIINFDSGNRFALNTWSYGGITKNLADYLDSAIGMILASGGIISNVTIDSPTMRYPLISQANIASANFSQDISAITTQDNYLQVYNSAGTLNFIGNQSEIVPLSGGTDNPQYISSSTGSLTNLAADKFMNVWMVALPLAAQNPYTTDYVFVTGDMQYDDLATAQSANFNDDYTISLMKTLFERFFVAYRFTLTFNGTMFTIADYKSVSYNVGEGSGTGGGSTGAGMPIGTIITSNASSSYTPENTVYTDGTEYTEAQFTKTYSLLESGQLESCTYEEYENSITQTGECWICALDTANQKFKVPTIKDIVVRGIKDTIEVEYGNGVKRSTGEDVSGQPVDVAAFGPVSGGNATLMYSDVANVSVYGYSSELGNSALQADTQGSLITQTIRHYYVIATGSINQSEMDWSQWASSLQGKANTDLSNLTTSGKKVIDGQWVAKTQTLTTATTPQTIEVDLSEYLPEDEYNYEVAIICGCYQASGAVQGRIFFTTSIIPTIPFEQLTSQGFKYDIQFSMPVGADKKINIKIQGGFTEQQADAIAYRRIGTND